MTPRARRAVAIVTLGLALLLVAVLTLRAFGVPIALGPAASPSPQPTATPEPTPSPPPGVAEELAALEAQVAELRDLPPADIGPAQFISREELEERLAELFEADYSPEEAAADNLLYHALGMLAPDQDYGELQLQLLSGQVIGYYDDTTRTMFIVSEAGLTPEAQAIYAHEYTHALQDAAFGIDSLLFDAEGDDDGAFARLSLVEGDATTAMVVWAIANLSPEELFDISETPLPDTTGIPAWLIRQLEFPYLEGSTFTSQLYAQAGFAGVDEAWADPPVSTEQLLHFSAYVEDETPVLVAPIDPDIGFGGAVQVVEETTFGEAMIAIWLTALGVDRAEAEPAAAGWGGDGITTLTNADGEMAVVLNTVWDTPVDADEFAAAYEVARERLSLFAHLDRPDETTVIVIQGSSEAFVESFAGPLD